MRRGIDTRKIPETRQLQAQCDAFNRAHPIGTPVTLTFDLGNELEETVETKTRSAAQILGGHTAVIWVEGYAGCYELDRVQPLLSKKIA